MSIWLLPFFPSPLRDDGYDISDYTAVHPSYGLLEDFKAFLAAAHDRGMRNHHRTGSKPHVGSAFLVPRITKLSRELQSAIGTSGVKTDDHYREVRIIFVDTEMSNWAWDPLSKSIYMASIFQPST